MRKPAWNMGVVRPQRGMGKENIGGVQENQEGIQGQWQEESPFKEVLEQVKRSADTDCGAQKMRRANNAKKSGNAENFQEECRKEGKLCEWTLDRLQEAYEQVAMGDIDRLSIAKEILRKSTEFLRRIIAPGDWMGGVTFLVRLPALQLLPSE